jgi:hypothetical protein
LDEFYELLKEMWTIVENYIIDEEERIDFELDDILNPGDASIEELIKYFIYCCGKVYIYYNTLNWCSVLFARVFFISTF